MIRPDSKWTIHPRLRLKTAPALRPGHTSLSASSCPPSLLPAQVSHSHARIYPNSYRLLSSHHTSSQLLCSLSISATNTLEKFSCPVISFSLPFLPPYFLCPHFFFKPAYQKQLSFLLEKAVFYIISTRRHFMLYPTQEGPGLFRIPLTNHHVLIACSRATLGQLSIFSQHPPTVLTLCAQAQGPLSSLTCKEGALHEGTGVVMPQKQVTRDLEPVICGISTRLLDQPAPNPKRAMCTMQMSPPTCMIGWP